jgi:copper chaperone CopZ
MKPILALLLCASFPAVSGCAAPRTAELRTSTLVLSITGMTCAVYCPGKVQAALASVEGVESATVDYDTRTATVRMREGVDPALLTAAVRKQGFGAVPR